MYNLKNMKINKNDNANCQIKPSSYKSYFNDNTYLNGVAPYKINKVNINSSNTKPNQTEIRNIEYRNFYSDWKKDSLNYYKNNEKEYASRNIYNNDSQIGINTIDNYNIRGNQGRHNIYQKPNSFKFANSANNKHNKNLHLYEETRNKKPFAVPMHSNGSNLVSDMFNDCVNKKTFEYRKYSNISPHNVQWIDNPLFTGDITHETQKLSSQYIDSIPQKAMDLYSSVFEDMYILGYDVNTYDEIDKNINNSLIANIRKS